MEFFDFYFSSFALLVPCGVAAILLFILSVIVSPIDFRKYEVTRIVSKYSWIFWFLIPLLSYLATNRVFGQIANSLVPNLSYFFAYSPLFFDKNLSKSKIYINGALCIVSTVMVWWISMVTYRWLEAGLIFGFLPFSFLLVVALTFIFLNIRRVDVNNRLRYLRWPGVVVTILAVGMAVVSTYTEHSSSREMVFMNALSCRIKKFLRENRGQVLSTDIAIKNQLFVGLYDVKDGHVFNKYGGDIELSELNNILKISYSGISGDHCLKFRNFFAGFESPEKLYIDGQQIDKFRGDFTKACEKKKVQIDFEAPKNDIIFYAPLECKAINE